MHLLLDDKRELINARRRATYLKNKENADINKEQLKAPGVDGKHDGKHLHQNMPAVDTSGTTISILQARRLLNIHPLFITE